MIFEETALAFLVLTMVVLVSVQVLSRYVFHVSLSHTEEIVRYLFVWATFLGAAGAAFRGRHLAVSAGWKQKNHAVMRRIRFIIGTGALLFALALLVYGTKIVMLQAVTAQKTAALGLPMWCIGLAVPAGSALLIFRILQRARKGGER
ncbi:MAG: TRAP transporter small permease [Candidatus Latescibacterota bacterium]